MPPDAAARPAGTSDLLRVTARPMDGRGRVVVEVVGQVDAETAALLEACLRGRARAAGLRRLVVDVSGGIFLGGAGPAVLADTRRRCRQSGARLVVRGADGQSAVSGAPQPGQRAAGGPSSSRPHSGHTRVSQHAGSPPSSGGAA